MDGSAFEGTYGATMKHERSDQLAPVLDRELRTPKQISARWQCSIEKLKRMRRAGILPVYYIGRSARYAMEDILRIEADAKA